MEQRIQELESRLRGKKSIDVPAINKNLMDEEDLFHRLFDNMPSGSAIYEVINDGSKGSDYIIKGFNRKSLEIEGKILNQVLGKSLQDLRPNIDQYGLIPVMKKVWDTGDSAYHPVKIYQDEKFSNYYENYIFKIPCGHVVTIYNDVTEQKLTELELKKHKERLALAMSFANDGLFDWNLTTNEIYYSPVWKSLLGYRDDELPNSFSEWERLTHKKDVETSWAMVNEVFQKKRHRFQMEFKMRHKDGHWIDILSRAKVIFDKDGTASRMVGTHVDITERKRAERTLADSERKLNDIINFLPDPTWAIDLDGKIIAWNNAAELLTGVKREKILGKNDNSQAIPFYGEIRPTFANLVLNPSKEWEKKYNNKKKIDGELVSAESYHREMGANGRYLAVNASKLFDAKGNVVGAIQSIRDITGLKNSQEEREHLIEELQAALNSVKTLSGLVPICSSCKKIRDDKGYWNMLESYIEKHSKALFSHSMCPECSDKLYGDKDWYIKMKKSNG